MSVIRKVFDIWNIGRSDGEKQPNQPAFLDGANEQDPRSLSLLESNDAHQQEMEGNAQEIESPLEQQYSEQHPQQELQFPALQQSGSNFQQHMVNNPQLPGNHLDQPYLQQNIGFQAPLPINMQAAAYSSGYVKEEPMDDVQYRLGEISNFIDQPQTLADASAYQQVAAPLHDSLLAASPYYRGFTPDGTSAMGAIMGGRQSLETPTFELNPQNLRPANFDYRSYNSGSQAIPQQQDPRAEFQDPGLIQQSIEHEGQNEDAEMSDDSHASAIETAIADYNRDTSGSEYQASESGHGDEDDDEDESEDDKPLKNRVHHDGSSHGRSSPKEVVPPKVSEKKVERSPSTAAGAAKQKVVLRIAPTKTADQSVEQPDENKQSPKSEQSEVIDLTDDTPVLNWKLPEFEAIYEPPATASDYPIAKISLPGLVRHQIILSIDHHATEAHLFEHVFLPAQRTLYATSPDVATTLDPMLSVLNFHTIVGLCVEGFYANSSFSGDVLPNPPGSNPSPSIASNPPHTGSEKRKPLTKKEMERIDVDQVFFTAMDSYRIGLLARRDNYYAIRGVQEFCEVALDISFWIKEHGFGVKGLGVKEDGTERVRRERSDKGVKRGSGAKKGKKEKEGDREWTGEEEGFAKPKATKSGKVNVLQAKKKPNSKTKQTAKGAAKGRGKTAAGKVKGGRVTKTRK